MAPLLRGATVRGAAAGGSGPDRFVELRCGALPCGGAAAPPHSLILLPQMLRAWSGHLLQHGPAGARLAASWWPSGGAAVGAQADRGRARRSAFRPTRAMACPKAPRCRRSTCPAPTVPAAPAGPAACTPAHRRRRRDRDRRQPDPRLSRRPRAGARLVAHRRPGHHRRRRLPARRGPQEDVLITGLRPQRRRPSGWRPRCAANGASRRPWSSARRSRRCAPCCGRRSRRPDDACCGRRRGRQRHAARLRPRAPLGARPRCLQRRDRPGHGQRPAAARRHRAPHADALGRGLFAFTEANSR